MTDQVITEALNFFRLCEEADTTNRANALSDLRFRYGEQWPVEIQNSRKLENRVCLTINKIDTNCRQVLNGMRQQRPRIKVHGVNTLADEKIADVITGICRHIEVNSDADQAYDTAADAQVTHGRGYWRIITDYVREDSFEQEIFIKPIENPFSVSFDPNSVMPDGSDAERCMITEMMPKALFRKFYPGKDDGANFRAFDNSVMSGWMSEEDIRIAEYFRVERTLEDLLLLSNGSTKWADAMTPEALALFQASGISVVSSRKSFRRKVIWTKMTAMEVIEERPWPGRFIPVIPVYGNVKIIDGKREFFGLVRQARDPQIMFNFWRTALTETIALAPKAKYLVAEGQIEGHEKEWQMANISAMPTLTYKHRDAEGNEVGVPQRIQPEGPVVGIMEAANSISDDLQTVLGTAEPAQRIDGNVSGKALNAERQQTDNANFHYYDNLTRSIRWGGKIILDLIPHIYDTQRVMRIIGSDDQPKMITVNEKAADRVLNDVTVGQYDVVMDTGPGYSTKRQEAVDSMMPLFQHSPDLLKLAGDVMFRNMDFPGADAIAERLAAANPLAQLDEESEVPPQAQMMIKNLQQQLQQCQQQLRAAGLEIKFRHGLEKMRQDGETQRAHINATVKAHDTEVRAQTTREDAAMKERTILHEVQSKIIGAQNVEELKGAVQLMLHHISSAQLEKQANEEEREILG